MKLCFLIYFICFSKTLILAQNKQDYLWFFGNDKSPEEKTQGYKYDFNNSPFESELSTHAFRFDFANASICDKEGNLLLYTNGCFVADRAHNIMPNGNRINDTEFLERYWNDTCAIGYPMRQDVLILDDPGNEQGYYIIHKPITLDELFNPLYEDIWYSYVDLTLNDGYGDLTIKNKLLKKAKIAPSYLSAIRHENKKDWWLINPIEFDQGYYTFLITENGIEEQPFQQIGPEFKFGLRSAGNGWFSPDGTKYAYFNVHDGLHLYDFDRSTGLLSNLKRIESRSKDPVNFVFGCMEFSSNSRFLYLSNLDTLWQVDTWEQELSESMEIVGLYDGGTDPLPSRFFSMALAPDCKIYMRSPSSARHAHVIHKPNEKGLACDFVQRGLFLPQLSSIGTVPNFPRFRVDEEEKCDPSISTFAGEEVYWRRDLHAYPNPVSDYLTIVLPEQTKGSIFIVDMQGQILDQVKDVVGKVLKLDVSKLSFGIYSLEFVPNYNPENLIYTKMINKI